MYGDIVKGELETTIKMNCNGYGPCVDGLPAVNLTQSILPNDDGHGCRCLVSAKPNNRLGGPENDVHKPG